MTLYFLAKLALCLAIAYQIGRTVEARAARRRTAKLNAEHRVECIRVRWAGFADGFRSARAATKQP